MPNDVVTKETAIATAKEFRRDLDAILQRMKEHKTTLRTLPASDALDPGEVIAQHIINFRDVESAIMRQGLVLKSIGNPDPYPESRDPSSPVVAPTADGLKL